MPSMFPNKCPDCGAEIQDTYDFCAEYECGAVYEINGDIWGFDKVKTKECDSSFWEGL